ncbi:MAG: bifunctional 5,10-methylenetetrahydrofolate dehydrogenase/5,10-methenyltetrahydrofolate cyclohydrolase [Eggerthellaceae bacterium]|nr:bifunctional 5,10-methylenetetrahydrofolate dehydrogenase/5,10-methenyltetrahydrofolate cyclohydrolase [Eggerthellaceae bacterium]
MATILKGSEVVEAMNNEIAAEVEKLKARGVDPTLAIVRVGERGDDISYERGATKRAEKVGVAVRNVLLPEDVSQEELIAAIEGLNADDAVHGVLLFRPLPKHIDEDAVRNTLDPRKDIDGITDLSLAGVFASSGTGFAPCTAQACMEILDFFGYDLKGKSAVVVGRSLVVGKPAAMMLLDRNATVTVAHSRTQDLAGVCRSADVVIACVGRAAMVGADYLRAGQVVIDVGINVAEDGSLIGDVDFGAAESIVDAITPVPGGVGTVTTSVLVKHVVQSASCSVI